MLRPDRRHAGMRSLFGAALLLTVDLCAQTTLTTTYTANYFLASLDGAVYFDLIVPQPLQVHRLDLNLHSGLGAIGDVDVYVRPGSWVDHIQARGDWTLAAHGAVVSAGPQQATPCPLDAPIGLPAGIHGVALHHKGVMPAYMFTFGPRTYTNGELTLVGGGSSTLLCGGQQFVSRVFSGAVHYTLGGGPFALAGAAPHGSGCHQGTRSFYEHFLPGTFDLAGQRLLLTPNAAGGYDVARSAGGTITLPAGAHNLDLVRGGAAFVPLPTPLTFPGGSTPALLVLPDGRALLGDEGLLGSSTAGAAASTLLLGRPTLAALWQDFAPGGADNVYTHLDPATGDTTVIWWQLPVFGGPTNVRSTFALTVRTNGTLEVRIANAANPTDACLVGFSAGNGARDPGCVDLSQRTAFATTTDSAGLQLQAEGRPALGTVTTLRVLGGGGGLSTLLFSWQLLTPALDLAALGVPDCALHLDPTTSSAVNLGTTSHLPVPVPAAPFLLGATLHAQAAHFAAGLTTSNAVTLTVGTV